MIIEKLVVGPLNCNCYIIADEENHQGLIIDPGGDAKKILSSVKQGKLNINLIVLTHGHVDHFIALKRIKEVTRARLAMHKNDASLKNYPLNFWLNIKIDELPRPEILLDGGEIMKVGRLEFKVLHTPGHSPGGICLYGEGACFTGDTLFNHGIGRSDLAGGAKDRLLASIYNELMILPDNVKVYPGHGPETTIGTERRDNPYI